MRSMMRRLTLMAATIAAAAMLLSGCSGSDGAAGAPGATGATGATGAAGPVTSTDPSCVVCHNTNDLASVEIVHGFTNDPNNLNTRSKVRNNEKNFVATITNVGATAANLPTITLNVKLNGANFTVLTKEYLSRIVIADQVPAGTVTTRGTFGSPYWENWAYEAGTGTGASAVAFDAADAANGNYIITLPKAWGGVAGSNVNVADYNPAHIQRVYVRVGAPSDSTTNATTHANYLLAFPNGITDFTRFGLSGVGNAAAVKDIAAVPAVSTSATLLAEPTNQYVTVEACRKCHGPQLNGAAHGNGYVDTLACVMCHSPLSGTGANPFYLPRFMHQIHAAIDVPEFPTRILGAGFKDVTFPQAVSNCIVCHTASGKTFTTVAANKIDNWKTNPTAEICGSCHTAQMDVVNKTTTAAHTGGANRTPASCVLCHPDTEIVAMHTPAVAAANVPEYDVTMSITPPASGTFYVAGETPTVTVTLKDKATGAAVPGSVYTAAKHAAGTFIAASLAKASLYVYGPRSHSVPVLTRASANLSAAGVPTQAQPLFVGTAFGTPAVVDAQVLTDTTGFKYQLSPIPAGTSGTFMVRFIAQNYGYVSDTNYKIDSTAFQNIQIGTATVEPKVSGNGCVDCHGTGTLGAHDARHSVIFDTDQCLSCHDRSENHGDTLDNRVHAVHSASTNGDALGIDWSAVTYPQGIPTSGGDETTGLLSISGNTGASRCITCHTTTSTTWKSAGIAKKACQGCHADKPGAINHMLQMGGK